METTNVYGIPDAEYEKIKKATRTEMALILFRKEIKNKDKHIQRLFRRDIERIGNAMMRVTFARITGRKLTFEKLPLPY